VRRSSGSGLFVVEVVAAAAVVVAALS